MSRKNLLAGLAARSPRTTDPAEPEAAPSKMPLKSLAGRGAFGAVTRTLDDLAARAEKVKELEDRLLAGTSVVDLDPTSVDRSFIDDRMEEADDSYALLLEAIRARGQESPILVRPHPQQPGRYQAAFGHRRLRAALELGRPVRAMLRQLSNLDLVIAQGQENSARSDLSFVERARFAKRMEQGGYTRETIMLALGIDKTALSRMISVANKVPPAVIEAIGPARGVGRSRWMELVELFRAAPPPVVLDDLFQTASFVAAKSDERFEAVCATLAPPQKSKVQEGRALASYAAEINALRVILSQDGRQVARISSTSRSLVLAVDRRVDAGFADYVFAKLEALYRAYRAENSEPLQGQTLDF